VCAYFFNRKKLFPLPIVTVAEFPVTPGTGVHADEVSEVDDSSVYPVLEAGQVMVS
jgi:hypothetical protein